MTRFLSTSALALSLVAGMPALASAQSYNAPAGIPSATAPGGLEGADGFANARQFVRPAVPVAGLYTSGSVVPASRARLR